MNAIDILGSLLGRKTKRGGSKGGGGSILKEILKGRPKPAPRPQQAPQPQSRSPQPRYRDPNPNLDRLEDMLQHAGVEHSHRRRGEAPPPRPQRQPAPQPQQAGHRHDEHGHIHDLDPETLNENATILIRAMVNAAKSDGQIDQQEQDAIVGQLGHVSQDEVQFLRSEFAKPLDVREFSWSVPLGMEEQVYGLSVMAIDLDANREAQYLRDLAHGLRLPPDVCNQIHQRFNAPAIFS